VCGGAETLRVGFLFQEVPLSYIEALDTGYFHLLVNWLGGRQDGLYDMNVGVAPPLVVVSW